MISFNKTQQKIMAALYLRDDIKTAYNIERNNRLVSLEFKKMENNNWIIRDAKGFARLNVEKIKSKYPNWETDQKEMRGKLGVEIIGKNPSLATFSKSTSKEIFKKAQELLKEMNK